MSRDLDEFDWFAKGARARLAELMKLLEDVREGRITPEEYERLIGPRRYGPLDPNDPLDKAHADQWRVYEETKKSWIAGGCQPEQAPQLVWDPTPGNSKCGAVLTPKRRVRWFKVRRAKPQNDPPPHTYIRARQRQPASRRRRLAQARAAAATARGDPDGGDPDGGDPERRKTPPADEGGGVQRLICNGPRTTRTRARIGFVQHESPCCKLGALSGRDGATWAR
jgi:hypothetical protein